MFTETRKHMAGSLRLKSWTIESIRFATKHVKVHFKAPALHITPSVRTFSSPGLQLRSLAMIHPPSKVTDLRKQHN